MTTRPAGDEQAGRTRVPRSLFHPRPEAICTPCVLARERLWLPPRWLRQRPRTPSAGMRAPRRNGPMARRLTDASLHRLDALDQRLLLGAVLVPHRLDRILEQLAIGNLVMMAPASFIFASNLVPRALYQSLRCSCCASFEELHDQRLIVLRQLLPGHLREHQQLRDHQMSGFRIVLRRSGSAGRSRSSARCSPRRRRRRSASPLINWSKPIATPLPPSEFIVSTNSGLPIMRILGPSGPRPSRSASSNCRRCGCRLHVAETDQPRGRMIGELLRSSSPIGPSITFSICAPSRNTNGRLKTFELRTSGPSGRRRCARSPARRPAPVRSSPSRRRARRREHLDRDAPAGAPFQLLCPCARPPRRSDRRCGCTSVALSTSFAWAKAGAPPMRRSRSLPRRA